MCNAIAHGACADYADILDHLLKFLVD